MVKMADNLTLYSLLLCPLKASDMYFLRILGLNQKVNVRISPQYVVFGA